LFASWYAAAMYACGRSGEALELLNRLGPATDGITTTARAYLAVDQGLADRAEADYRQVAAKVGPATVLGETILLLAGDAERVAANCVRLIDVVPPQTDLAPSLRYLAGRLSEEGLLASAGESRYKRCGVHYVIAMAHAARGDRSAARAHHARSVETGTHWRVEFQWSRAFLARMNQDDARLQEASAQVTSGGPALPKTGREVSS
jgi:hypothetical protein